MMFEIDSNIISSEELTQRIMKKMKEKGIPLEKRLSCENIESASDLETLRGKLQSISEIVTEMEQTWMISEPMIVSSKKLIGPLVIFIKKVIRKSLRWLLRPYFEQISSFNDAVMRVISDSLEIQDQLVDIIEDMFTQEENL